MDRCLFVVIADVWICSLVQQELYYINMTPANVVLNQKQTSRRNKISLYLWNLSHIPVLYLTLDFKEMVISMGLAFKQNWFKVRAHNLSNYRHWGRKYTSNLQRDLLWLPFTHLIQHPLAEVWIIYTARGRKKKCAGWGFTQIFNKGHSGPCTLNTLWAMHRSDRAKGRKKIVPDVDLTHRSALTLTYDLEIFFKITVQHLPTCTFWVSEVHTWARLCKKGKKKNML